MLADDYIDDKSLTTSNQYTIPKNSVSLVYDNLNEEGYKLYHEILARVRDDDYDGFVTCSVYTYVNSGFDKSDHRQIHPRYRNVSISGRFSLNGVYLQSVVPVMFYTLKWCYTTAGILYKIS